MEPSFARWVFNPTNLVISPGDRVVWTNTVARAHDTTHDTRVVGGVQLWSSPNLLLNQTFGFTFTNAGYYPYMCRQHIATRPEQTGTVSVVAASITNLVSADGSVRFQILGGRAGLSSVVEAGNGLGSWSAIATNPFPAGGIIDFTNNSPPPDRRFYRARVIP